MTIFPPSGNPWRNPQDDEPFASIRRTAHGDHAIVLRPGADVRDLVGALRALPASAIFTDHFGDVNVTLVFRPVPGTAPGATRPPLGDLQPTRSSHTDRWISTGPIDRPPWGLPSQHCADAVYDSLTGVDLGEHDHTIIHWLARWDAPTVTTVASLLRRARRADLPPRLLRRVADRSGRLPTMQAVRSGRDPPHVSIRPSACSGTPVISEKAHMINRAGKESAHDEWLTAADVIAEVRVPRSTFYRWRQLGIGPRSVKLPNGDVRIRRSWLDGWLRNLAKDAA